MLQTYPLRSGHLYLVATVAIKLVNLLPCSGSKTSCLSWSGATSSESRFQRKASISSVPVRRVLFLLHHSFNLMSRTPDVRSV